MTPTQVNQWLADMATAGRIRSGYGAIEDAMRLLGVGRMTLHRFAKTGTRDVQTDLAMAALLAGLPPYGD